MAGRFSEPIPVNGGRLRRMAGQLNAIRLTGPQLYSTNITCTELQATGHFLWWRRILDEPGRLGVEQKCFQTAFCR